MHPILFHVPTPWGHVPIYSYGVMLGLSLIVAWYFIMAMGRRKEGLDQELMANCFIVTAISAIAGARLLYILTNLDDFETVGSWFQFRSGGLVAYGGFLGGFFGSWGYLYRKGVPLLVWADLVSPTLGSGLFFTRIGCYLYGCDFGKPLSSDAPGWLKALGTFPHWPEGTGPADLVCAQDVHGAPAWSHHVAEYDLSRDAVASLPVHPTQIYESLIGLILFGVTMLVWRKRAFRGQVLFVLVMCYGAWRFLIEMVRDDPERGGAAGFSTSQIISLVLVPLAIAAYVVFRKRSKEKGERPIPAHAKHKAPSAKDGAAGETAEGKGKPQGARKRKPKGSKKK